MNNLIAQLQKKHCRSNRKTKYWILELKPLNSKLPKTTNFYLFNQKARWASYLQLEKTYCWTYSVNQRGYSLIQDWKLLGEAKTVKRCWGFFKEHAEKT